MAIGGVGLVAFAVPLALAVLGVDFFDPRNLIGSVVPFLLVAAVGFGAARPRLVGAAATAAGCVVFLAIYVAVYQSPDMQRTDWRGAAAAIGPAPRPRILVVSRDGDFPFAHYLGTSFLTDSNEPQGGVREIDALSNNRRIKPLGHGFRLVSRRKLSSVFTLWSFRSGRPVYVPPQALAGQLVLNEDSSVLVQTP